MALNLQTLLDPSGSGYISLDRLISFGNDIVQSKTEKKIVENELRSLDIDGTGYISYDKFCNTVSKILTDCDKEKDSGTCSPVHQCKVYLQSDSELTMLSKDTPDFISTQDHNLADMDSNSNKSTNNTNNSQCSSLSDGESYECLGEGSSSSPVPNSQNETPSSGQLRRNHWTRSSLRRTPNQSPSADPNFSRKWGSFRQNNNKRVTAVSNAPASPLYRSASFNSSGRSSNCGDPDDMYCSDASLEEDVLGLNRKVQMLQQQVLALADTQNNSDDRVGRLRQENAMLTARVMILEEQLREEQVRNEQRLEEELRRHKEIMNRIEREKQLELENSAIRLQASERKCESLEDEIGRLKAQAERQVTARHIAEQNIADLDGQLQTLRNEYNELEDLHSRQQENELHEKQTSQQVVEDLRLEIERLRSQNKSQNNNIRTIELENQIKSLQEKCKHLTEALEEAQAQLLSHSVEQGRTLLGVGTSLADELEEMSVDKLDNETLMHNEQVRAALREQQEVNIQLRSYIDGILLNIVENYPQLLEVKRKN